MGHKSLLSQSGVGGKLFSNHLQVKFGALTPLLFDLAKAFITHFRACLAIEQVTGDNFAVCNSPQLAGTCQYFTRISQHILGSGTHATRNTRNKHAGTSHHTWEVHAKLANVGLPAELFLHAGKPMHTKSTCNPVLKMWQSLNGSTWENFKSDLWPCRMAYEAFKWITTNLQESDDQKRIQLRVGHSRMKSTSSMTGFFVVVQNGHGTSQFQWRLSQSHCEYSGVTYDLLVSNIRGTHDLAAYSWVTAILVIFCS